MEECLILFGTAVAHRHTQALPTITRHLQREQFGATKKHENCSCEILNSNEFTEELETV